MPPRRLRPRLLASGALLGARAAIACMQRQESGGKVFFVDGNGRWVAWLLGGRETGQAALLVSPALVLLCSCCCSWPCLPFAADIAHDVAPRSWGNPTPGNAAYGATKRALPQLKDSLAAELAAAASSSSGGRVGVHIVSPGMVATELLFRYADTPRKGEERLCCSTAHAGIGFGWPV